MSFGDDSLFGSSGSGGGGGAVSSVFGRAGDVVAATGDYTPAQVGLGNVTNESKATMFTNSTFTGTTAASTINFTTALQKNGVAFSASDLTLGNITIGQFPLGGEAIITSNLTISKQGTIANNIFAVRSHYSGTDQTTPIISLRAGTTLGTEWMEWQMRARGSSKKFEINYETLSTIPFSIAAATNCRFAIAIESATTNLNYDGGFGFNPDRDFNIYKPGAGGIAFGFDAGLNTITSDCVFKIGTATNYALFENGTTNGFLSFTGTSRAWKDLAIGGASLGAGASAPDMVAYNATNIMLRGFDGGATLEQLYDSLEIQHDYAEGTNITPHLHWLPSTAGAGDVKWQLEYTIIRGSTVVVAPTTVSVTTSTTSTAWVEFISNFTAITGTNVKIGDQLLFRLFRNPADAADTYGADAVITTIGFHYLADTIGSRTISTK